MLEKLIVTHKEDNYISLLSQGPTQLTKFSNVGFLEQYFKVGLFSRQRRPNYGAILSNILFLNTLTPPVFTDSPVEIEEIFDPQFRAEKFFSTVNSILLLFY
jgi:hypothetical protein